MPDDDSDIQKSNTSAHCSIIVNDYSEDRKI